MSGNSDTPGGNPASSGASAVVRTLFLAMLREEWRMHTTLFGRRRFAAFPIFVALISAAGVHFLAYAGVGMSLVVGGVHGLAFAFGLQTGTVGFLGRDAMQDLLGGITLLVFSARTLPLSRGQALGVFVVKDLVYYSILFLLPLTLAFAPAVWTGNFGADQLPLLWVTLTAAFTYGIAVTVLLIGLFTRGKPGRVVALLGAAGVGLAWVAGIDVLAATPWALYEDPSIATAALGLAPIFVLVGIGMVLHDSTYQRPARSAGDRFAGLTARLPVDDRGLVARSLLEVHRSSGGIFKLVFSGGIIFAVCAFLMILIEPIVGGRPSTGVTFGSLLALTAFTTYNWLTQFDSIESYRRLPLDAGDVFEAKLWAFLALGLPVGLAYLVLAIALFGAQPLEVLAGVALLVGIEIYLFGLTVWLSGFSPNEFLFDTVLFALFGAAIAAALVPVLVIGFVVVPVPPVLLAGLVGFAGFLAGVGLVLYRWAIPKWEEAHLAGEV